MGGEGLAVDVVDCGEDAGSIIEEVDCLGGESSTFARVCE